MFREGMGVTVPNLPKGNYVVNVRFKFILKEWVGFGNLAGRKSGKVFHMEKSLNRYTALGVQEEEWFHIEEVRRW